MTTIKRDSGGRMHWYTVLSCLTSSILSLLVLGWQVTPAGDVRSNLERDADDGAKTGMETPTPMAWSQFGLPGVHVWVIAFDPQDPLHVYVGATGPSCSAPPRLAITFTVHDYTNFYQSFDGGQTWTGTTIGEKACVSGTTRVEPASSGQIYVLHPGVGLAWSGDGGNTWTFAPRIFWGDPSNRSQSYPTGSRRLVMAPDLSVMYVDVGRNPTDQRFPGHSLAKSLDGGQTWERTGPSLRLDARILLATQNDPNIVVVSDGITGLWRTDDAGATWTNFTQQIPPGTIDMAIMNPADSSMLLALNRAPESPGQVGLWRTDDGGAQWRLVYAARDLRLIAFDPRVTNGNGLIAATTQEALYSSDGGITFVSLGRPPRATSEPTSSTWYTTGLFPAGDRLLVGGSNGIWQVRLPPVQP
jgi:photosystem II stability/assembly factor-like uncharacterized protein